MARYIDADVLTEELKSLQVTITGMRGGKELTINFAEEYMKSVLRIIEYQPTVHAALKSKSVRNGIDDKILIKKANNIITEAIDHGGDSGGAYFSNEDCLVDAMKDLIRCLGKEDEIGILSEDGGYIKFYLKRFVTRCD